jgi:hypothetical protein
LGAGRGRSALLQSGWRSQQLPGRAEDISWL